MAWSNWRPKGEPESAVVRAYRGDPRFHRKDHSPVGNRTAQDHGPGFVEARKISLPLLILQGAADKLVDPGGARILFDRVGSADKTIKVYEGLYHEVFNEPERGRVLDDVEKWLAARLEPGP